MYNYTYNGEIVYCNHTIIYICAVWNDCHCHAPYTEILPPISLSETEYSQNNTYTKTMTSQGSYNYTVHSGAQFGIECSSIATPDNEFVGTVTWYKRTTNMSGLYSGQRMYWYLLCVHLRVHVNE